MRPFPWRFVSSHKTVKSIPIWLLYETNHCRPITPTLAISQWGSINRFPLNQAYRSWLIGGSRRNWTDLKERERERERFNGCLLKYLERKTRDWRGKDVLDDVRCSSRGQRFLWLFFPDTVICSCTSWRTFCRCLVSALCTPNQNSNSQLKPIKKPAREKRNLLFRNCLFQ